MMNERVEELLETLEAILQDLNALGFQFIVVLSDATMEHPHTFRTRNHAVTYALLTMIERKIYNDLCDVVEGDDDE